MTQKKGGHAVTMQPKTLTEEEKRAVQWRSVAQKIEGTAQMVLCNLAGNPAAVERCTGKDGSIDITPLVRAAVDAGAAFAKQAGDTLGAIYRELFGAAEPTGKEGEE